MNTEQSHTEHIHPMPSDLFLVNSKKDTFYNIRCHPTTDTIDSVTTAIHSGKLTLSSKKILPIGQEYLA